MVHKMIKHTQFWLALKMSIKQMFRSYKIPEFAKQQIWWNAQMIYKKKLSNDKKYTYSKFPVA